jgi:hypothetical protein
MFRISASSQLLTLIATTMLGLALMQATHSAETGGSDVT